MNSSLAGKATHRFEIPVIFSESSKLISTGHQAGKAPRLPARDLDARPLHPPPFAGPPQATIAKVRRAARPDSGHRKATVYATSISAKPPNCRGSARVVRAPNVPMRRRAPASWPRSTPTTTSRSARARPAPCGCCTPSWARPSWWAPCSPCWTTAASARRSRPPKRSSR